MDKLSNYKGATKGTGEAWKSQIVLNRTTYYLGQYPTAIEAARAYDNCAHALMMKGRARSIKLNFPGEWDTGEGSNPAYTEWTDKVVQAFLESGVPRRDVSFRLAPETEQKFRGHLQQVFDRLSKAVDESNESLNRLAEILYVLGDPKPMSARQSVPAAPAKAQAQPAWVCPEKNGCEEPCTCRAEQEAAKLETQLEN